MIAPLPWIMNMETDIWDHNDDCKQKRIDQERLI